MISARRHEKFVAKWGRTRSRGRSFFVWVWGVLSMGLGSGVLFTLVFFMVLAREHPDPAFIPFVLLVWLVAGYIGGSVMWSSNEWKYEETILLLEAFGRRPKAGATAGESSSNLAP